MATKEPSKSALYFVFKSLYLKNELGDPHFLLLKSDKHATLKLCGVRATLKFSNCEGSYESAQDDFLRLCRDFCLSVLNTLIGCF